MKWKTNEWNWDWVNNLKKIKEIAFSVNEFRNIVNDEHVPQAMRCTEQSAAESSKITSTQNNSIYFEQVTPGIARMLGNTHDNH